MIKLPRTSHIEGSGIRDADCVPFEELENKFLVVEEKLDGTGVSISFDENLDLNILHRGTSQANGTEYNLLHQMADDHCDELYDILGTRYVLFGEWLYNKHTIFYDQLPTYFFESDLYDSEKNIWLSTLARNTLLSGLKFLKSVPVIASGKFSALHQLQSLHGPSFYRSEKWKEELEKQCLTFNYDVAQALDETTTCKLCGEGLYIKEESETEVIKRYKYVPSSFIYTIINSNSHILNRRILPNKLKE